MKRFANVEGAWNVAEAWVPYDVVVVGARINGLGIARDAAARGLRMVVLEQDDLQTAVRSVLPA